jgi:hypothetical protein
MHGPYNVKRMNSVSGWYIGTFYGNGRQ